MVPRFKIVLLWLIAPFLLGCDYFLGDAQSGSLTAEEIAGLYDAKSANLTPEEVAETFALGGDFTDVQRDLLRQKLVGSVVEWEVRVYNVESRGRAYDVLSQPFAVRSSDAINLLRASIRIYPQSERDRDVLLGAKTDDAIRVRGRVEGIALRAVLFIDPSILVSKDLRQN